jgi:hypothetical protein
VAPGQELEEDGRVDGEVTPYSEAPEGGKTTDSSKVGGRRGEHTKHRGDTQREVEAPASAKDVAPKPPEHGAYEETDVLRECQEGSSAGVELERNRREDERGDDGPEVVLRPAKADDSEQLPLVSTHADVLDLGTSGQRGPSLRRGALRADWNQSQSTRRCAGSPHSSAPGPWRHRPGPRRRSRRPRRWPLRCTPGYRHCRCPRPCHRASSLRASTWLRLGRTRRVGRARLRAVSRSGSGYVVDVQRKEEEVATMLLMRVEKRIQSGRRRGEEVWGVGPVLTVEV